MGVVTVTGMADITNPDPTTNEGAAAMISGAVQRDGDDIKVVPQPGVENPYKASKATTQEGNDAQAKLLGSQPKVETDDPEHEAPVVGDEVKVRPSRRKREKQAEKSQDAVTGEQGE